jgi:COP9 signalosome complex subunit 1
MSQPNGAAPNTNKNTVASHEPQPSVKEELIPQVVPSKYFDLEQYISNYTGHTKIMRLIFIAERSKKHEVEAYKLAIDELKKTLNTSLYRKLFEKLGDKLGPGYTFDSAWADSVEKKAQQQKERLELDLAAQKANLIKEAIRAAHNELGNFFVSRGDFNSALRSYVRMRDYCSSNQQLLDMCLQVIKVSIELGNFAHVLSYVSKAEQSLPHAIQQNQVIQGSKTADASQQHDPTAIPAEERVITAKLNAAAGLAHLDAKKYKQAAKKFIETSFDLGNFFSDVISPYDVAIYGGLCALATYDRPELKRRVIENSDFKNYLDLVPDMRDLINDFYSSKYGSCLDKLSRFHNDLQLDIHLHDHIKFLYERIRNKAIVQYFSPFLSVDLATMAKAFNTDIQGLERELSRLIMEGVISARIDSHNKRLYAKQSDERAATFEKAITMGDSFQNDTKGLLLHINLIRNDFVLKPKQCYIVRETGRRLENAGFVTVDS